MSMQDTSLYAWVELQPALGDRQAIVYKAIQDLGTPTNKDIAGYLGIAINSITPRVLELRKMGLVERAGTVQQANGRPAIQWMIIKQRW